MRSSTKRSSKYSTTSSSAKGTLIPPLKFQWKLNCPQNKKHYTWPVIKGCYSLNSTPSRPTNDWITQQESSICSLIISPNVQYHAYGTFAFLCLLCVMLLWSSSINLTLKTLKKKPQYIITHCDLSYLQRGHLGLVLTLQNVFIKCMYSFWHNDSQGSSTQQPSTQNSHQLQSLLQVSTKQASSLRMQMLSLLSLINRGWGRGLLVT